GGDCWRRRRRDEVQTQPCEAFKRRGRERGGHGFQLCFGVGGIGERALTGPGALVAATRRDTERHTTRDEPTLFPHDRHGPPPRRVGRPGTLSARGGRS